MKEPREKFNDAVSDQHGAQTIVTGEQAGVQKARILSNIWTKKAFVLAYSTLLLTIFVNRFQVYTAVVYNAYATSSFSEHSLLSTAGVVSDITKLCAYPIIAKLGDVFGRAEGFAFSIAFSVVGSILYAACPNIETYLVAGIFDSIGDIGVLLTQQVFIADTTSFINRGFWSAVPESTTGIIAIYAGSLVADGVLNHSTWRWGYGMWALILPVCAIPLISIILIYENRAKRQYKVGTSVLSDSKNSYAVRVGRFLWHDLDILGAILLVAGFSLVLVPISLTGSASTADGWGKPSFIAMIVVGVVALIAFGVWDGKFAAYPFVPYRLLTNRTVIASCLLGGFDFCSYSIFTMFFPSYLQVAGGHSPGNASRINTSLNVAYQISRILTGILLRFSSRPQIWVYAGVPLCLLGQGLMIRFTNMPGGHVANTSSLVAAKVLVGVGRGLYHTASQVSVQAVVSKQQVAVATAVFLAWMTVGSAIGQRQASNTPIGSAIWRHTLPQKLTLYLPENAKGNATAIYESIVVARKFAHGTPARDAINQSYRELQKLLAIIGTAFLVPMIGLMFCMKSINLKHVTSQEEKGEQVEVEGQGASKGAN
ncbi:hypothetical protein AJ78_05566 [Emergomyces pasteurianus Ep9510]|uniref:Major facilitator superfamily (MFS) profile domain-containing protein n=1 Tax=Emergomyces pasteurianus Ep9510 TaxID=1447872 RepID=A0A1J9QDR4_9EURO|nr:hypothetical protein AJ78_05566 [Emergomyces pasteurianus Ep9510]